MARLMEASRTTAGKRRVREREPKRGLVGKAGGTVNGRKRRLDYTSPAAESLFGPNRFFITESFIDFVPNCTFAVALWNSSRSIVRPFETALDVIFFHFATS